MTTEKETVKGEYINGKFYILLDDVNEEIKKQKQEARKELINNELEWLKELQIINTREINYKKCQESSQKFIFDRINKLKEIKNDI